MSGQKQEGSSLGGPLLLVGLAALLLVLLQFAGKVRLPGALGDLVDELKAGLGDTAGQLGQGLYDAGQQIVHEAGNAAAQAAGTAGRVVSDWFKRLPPPAIGRRPDNMVPPGDYRVVPATDLVPAVDVARAQWEARHQQLQGQPATQPTYQPLPVPSPVLPVPAVQPYSSGIGAVPGPTPDPVAAAKLRRLEADANAAWRSSPTAAAQNTAPVATSTQAGTAAAVLAATAASAPWWMMAAQAMGEWAANAAAGMGNAAGAAAPSPAGFLAVPRQAWESWFERMTNPGTAFRT